MQIETVKELSGGGWLVNGSLSVPDDDNNRHCQAVKNWIAGGNTPEPADPLPEPGPDPDDELAAAIESATTLDELKAALLGNLTVGQRGRVAGKPV